MTGVQGGGCARKCSASSKETLSLAQGRKSTLTEKGVREKRRQPWSPHQQDGARRCCELHSPRPSTLRRFLRYLRNPQQSSL